MTPVNRHSFEFWGRTNAFQDLDEPEEYCFKISASYNSTAPSKCKVKNCKINKATHLPLKVTPTTFWLKCKNLPKCTKFCSTRKLEVAAKNFSLLTKNRLMHWQIQGLKGSISGNFFVVCLNL